MPILNDAVRSSTSKRGYGHFSFENLSCKHVELIKTINRHQRRKWHKGTKKKEVLSKPNRGSNGEGRKIIPATRRWGHDSVIPWQVLQILWDYGIKLTINKPSRSLRLVTFLTLLSDFIDRGFKNLSRAERKDWKAIRGLAQLIYEDTVRFEIMPRPKINRRRCLLSEKFIKGERDRMVPLSNIRKQSG